MIFFCGKNKLLIELSSEVVISQNKMKVDILLNLDMYSRVAKVVTVHDDLLTQ